MRFVRRPRPAIYTRPLRRDVHKHTSLTNPRQMFEVKTFQSSKFALPAQSVEHVHVHTPVNSLLHSASLRICIVTHSPLSPCIPQVLHYRTRRSVAFSEIWISSSSLQYYRFTTPRPHTSCTCDFDRFFIVCSWPSHSSRTTNVIRPRTSSYLYTLVTQVPHPSPLASIIRHIYPNKPQICHVFP